MRHFNVLQTDIAWIEMKQWKSCQGSSGDTVYDMRKKVQCFSVVKKRSPRLPKVLNRGGKVQSLTDSYIKTIGHTKYLSGRAGFSAKVNKNNN